MSHKALPILFINLSGEMMYILDQRLRAQNISQDKSEKVMYDIVKTMFNENFVTELFKPQEIYSKQAIRTVFERLAHSSIMRLNGTSMDKLYDLMTMVFKYQLCLCPCPKEVLYVTLNHLDGIKMFLQNSPDLLSLVDSVNSLIIENYAEMSSGQFQRLRYTLLTFFQDLQIRVSVLLKEGLQRPNGKFVLPRGGSVPYGSAIPGSIRVYNADGVVIKTATFPTWDNYDPATPEGLIEKDGNRGTKLGQNIYLEHENFEKSLDESSAVESPAAAESELGITTDTGACDQLSFLARLIGQTGQSNRPSTFGLGIFDEDVYEESDYTPPSAESSKIVNINASERMEENMLHKIMGDLTVKNEDSGEQDQDILDLLDVASA